MLTGERAAERPLVDAAEVSGVIGGRRDQRIVDPGAVQRAIVRLAAGDPARRLHQQVMTNVRLDDHHVDVLPGGLRGGDEGLLHPVPDLRQISAGDLERLVGEVHGGSRIGGDPRLRDHLGSFPGTERLRVRGRGAWSGTTLRAQSPALLLSHTYSGGVHTTLLSDSAVPGMDEDAAGVLGEVAVLLDGAGVPPRFRAGCHHSVSWFSHVLAAHLLGHAQDPTVPLRAALAAAIEDVRALHQGTCDLDRGGPSATVVAVRRTEEHLEHLVLCDSSLLLHDGEGGVMRVTDTRVDEVVRTERTAEAIEARRNRPGGFWVARHEPEAAAEAIVGSAPLARWERAHLVSDGVTRAADLLGLHDDASLADSLTRDPQAVLSQLREAEKALPQSRRPSKLHDDATVVTLCLAGSLGRS